MYEKGRSFIMAGGLVKAYEGNDFVYYHLLCQGFENIGKAILLHHDYDKYGPLLKKEFNHSLDRILTEITTLEGEEFFSKKAKNQLLSLNEFYKRQRLRYGHKVDFKNTSNIKAGALHSELVSHLNHLNKRFKDQ